jgi:hypothetical protein
MNGNIYLYFVLDILIYVAVLHSAAEYIAEVRIGDTYLYYSIYIFYLSIL